MTSMRCRRRQSRQQSSSLKKLPLFAALAATMAVTIVAHDSGTSSSAAERHHPQHEQQQNPNQEQQLNDIQIIQQQQQHRELYKQRTLSAWTSDSISKLRPIDLILSEDIVDSGTGMPAVYQMGAGGFLEPYDEFNYQEGSTRVSVGAGDVVGETNDGTSDGASLSFIPHSTSDRLGRTNFDIQRLAGLHAEGAQEAATERRAETTARQEEEDEGRRQLLRGVVTSTSDNNNVPTATVMTSTNESHKKTIIRDSFFIYAEHDPEELDQEIDLLVLRDRGHRDLHLPHLGYHEKQSESEVVVHGPTDAVEYDKETETVAHRNHPDSSSPYDNDNNNDNNSSNLNYYNSANDFANNNNDNNNDGNTNIESQAKQKDTQAPIIRSTFPPEGTKIGSTQSFGVLIADEGGSSIKKVCVQFRDHTNARSSCFQLQPVTAGTGTNKKGVSSEVWELSFDGFEAYQGKTWQKRFKSQDTAKNKMSTKWSDFIINIDDRENNNDGGGGDSTTEAPTPSPDEGETTEKPAGNRAPPAPATPLLEAIRDENWPHGGTVQSSTGRILFFINNNPYVCSGTVIRDDTPGRTIILTAAHCAYQYRSSGGGGVFAESALFIPNQDDTTGGRTNEVCSDDPMGCWVPAFAVVDRRWTEQGFPNSVPYDYAYYVIPDDPTSYQQGYLPPKSGFLDQDVEQIPVNFHYNQDIENFNIFTHGLGYSFNKDPNFRYCADALSTKFGISSYANLWLGICDMTGGSSGGPWMVDTDSNGRGTVVSVNSWGYSSSSGMAGPNLSTETGSHAECLFERAKSAPLYGVANGGLVVYDC